MVRLRVSIVSDAPCKVKLSETPVNRSTFFLIDTQQRRFNGSDRWSRRLLSIFSELRAIFKLLCYPSCIRYAKWEKSNANKFYIAVIIVYQFFQESFGRLSANAFCSVPSTYFTSIVVCKGTLLDPCLRIPATAASADRLRVSQRGCDGWPQRMLFEKKHISPIRSLPDDKLTRSARNPHTSKQINSV